MPSNVFVNMVGSSREGDSKLEIGVCFTSQGQRNDAGISSGISTPAAAGLALASFSFSVR
jgi:hypothetical protein